jgi:quercetin 2,3-dioxygenase
MAATRDVGILMDPVEVHEAQGVTIRRTVGSDKLVLLDPVILLDHMSVPGGAGEAGKQIGFPLHPHRGIETLTYVMEGRVQHKDSLGNEDAIGAHESQFMTAGGGIFHQEMMELGEGGLEGLQIWFNLPVARKMIPPAYRAARTGDIPVVGLPGGGSVRVVAGTFHGVAGAFPDIAVRPNYFDVHLPAGAGVTLPAPPGDTAFAFVYRGIAHFGGGREAPSHHLAIFADGDGVAATAGTEETRFVYVTATPLREPVLQYRSLVLSSVDEMKQALEDLENGTFVRQ